MPAAFASLQLQDIQHPALSQEEGNALVTLPMHSSNLCTNSGSWVEM